MRRLSASLCYLCGLVLGNDMARGRSGASITDLILGCNFFVTGAFIVVLGPIDLFLVLPSKVVGFFLAGLAFSSFMLKFL